MTAYTYTENEEIARWSTEVYIKTHPELGWWIAFTNPTAGPWKKIVGLSDDGAFVEIYRFIREEERPDLILVNDKLKTILIIEAKDYYEKLNTKVQMTKSIRVIKDVMQILTKSKNPIWKSRLTYNFIPSFLWMCLKMQNVFRECVAIQTIYSNLNEKKEELLNIVIYSDNAKNLVLSFNYKGKSYPALDFNF